MSDGTWCAIAVGALCSLSCAILFPDLEFVRRLIGSVVLTVAIITAAWVDK